MKRLFWLRLGTTLVVLVSVYLTVGLVRKGRASKPIDPAPFAAPQAAVPAADRQAPKLNKSPQIQLKAKAARQRVESGERQPEVARQGIAAAIQGQFAALGGRFDGPATPPLHPSARGYGQKVLDPAQQRAVDDLLVQLGPGAELQMDFTGGTLRYLHGDLRTVAESSMAYQVAQGGGDFGGMAVATVEALSRVMNIVEPAQEFAARPPGRDELNMVHVRLDQQHQGLPVYGAQVIVHFDAQGNPVEVQGVYAPTPSRTVTVDQEISEAAAIENARRAVNSAGAGLRPPKVERLYYWDPNVSPILAYQVDLVPALNANYYVFISVADGRVVHVAQRAFSAAASGQAKTLLGESFTMNSWQDGATYYALDTTLSMYNAAKSQPPVVTNIVGGVLLFDAKGEDWQAAPSIAYASSSNKDQWDPTTASVMSHFRNAFNYFQTKHNRSSWDNQGINLIGLVHAKFKNSSGQLYTDNAFFNPGINIIVCGDGEKMTAPGMLPAALDIVAHEYSHGVVDHSAAFKYENQSGALHEHMSDYFGNLIEGKNWLLGEDSMKGTGKIAWRDMSDPHNPNVLSDSPKNMSEYKNLPNTPEGDLGGVHINSTIPSYASYLFTEGPNGLGREKGGKIVYRALTQYMTQNSDFIDYRRAALSAAKDLYPDGAAANVVAQAFDSAQIYEAQATPPPTPVPATSGQDFVLFLHAEIDPFWGTFNGYGLYQLSAQENHAVASQYVNPVRPAVSGSGKWALYVGADNNVYWTDGFTEQAWTTSGDVRTIAMSKDNRYIAFTTTDYDNTIVLIDTTTKETRTATVTIPTSADRVNVGYTDVLTFNCLNDTLVFDAWTEGMMGQAAYGCWGLFSMRIKDLACWTVMPLTPELQVGNPSLANTLPYGMLADYIYTTNNQETVGCVFLDLNSNQRSVLLKGLNTYASATFRGDDTKIVFQTFDQNMYYLNEASLSADRSSLVANSAKQLLWSVDELAYPVGFRAGAYAPAAGKLTISPTTLDFGLVPVGQALTNTVVLNNAGNADLDLIEVSLENGEINSYDFVSTIQKSIPAGSGQTLKIKFHPDKTGTLPVSLRVKTTAPGQGDVTASLTGQGQAAAGGNYWRQAWQDFQDNYSYFDYKNVNWNNVYAQHTNDFANLTPDQFAVKLNDVLQVLQDWHVSVKKPDGTYLGYNGSYPRNYSTTFFTSYTGGNPYTNVNGSGILWHSTISNRIAFVEIDSFSSTAWAQAKSGPITDQIIDTLFALSANADGLIIDFRPNNGGSEDKAMMVASHLIDQPVTYGYVRNRIPQSSPYQFADFITKTLTPSSGAKFLKPVVGLMGQRCMSSAEWFTLMLRNCPNVILMGDRSRGASGSPITKGVPALNIEYDISTWMAYTDQKIPFEGKGIEPAVKIPAEASYDDNLKRDYVLEKAIEYLQWRVAMGQKLPRVSAATDTDRDGIPDVLEFVNGTDPTASQAWFGFQTSGIKGKPGVGVTLQWGSAAGQRYHLLRATAVTGPYSAVASGLSATPPFNSYTDTTATGNGPYFYRLVKP